MASWPIVRWTVPRLGVAYAWALPFLTMCRHFQRPAYQSGSFFAIFSPYGPIYFVARAPNLLDVHKPYAVVGGSGGSSHLDPSEPNSQKANGRKDRNGAFVA